MNLLIGIGILWLFLSCLVAMFFDVCHSCNEAYLDSLWAECDEADDDELARSA